MNFSPKPLKFAPGIWVAVMDELKRRGERVRETGAFLLAKRGLEELIVADWISYDDLEPGASHRGFVSLGPNAFSLLWAICDRRGVQVIADVHTHPKGPGQSSSDRAFPMVSLPGHIALIVPRYGHGTITPKDVSFNVYLGDGKWFSCWGKDADALILAP